MGKDTVGRHTPPVSVAYGDPLFRIGIPPGEESLLWQLDLEKIIQWLESRAPDVIRVTSFGRSAEGRELPLVIVSSDGAFTPAAARATGKPVLMALRPPVESGGTEDFLATRAALVAVATPVFHSLGEAAKAMSRVVPWSRARAGVRSG